MSINPLSRIIPSSMRSLDRVGSTEQRQADAKEDASMAANTKDTAKSATNNMTDSVQAPSTEQNEIQKAVDQLSAYIQNVERDLNFLVDEHSGELSVQVVDNRSQQVIRKIPSDELMQLAERFDKGNGLFINNKG